MKHLLTSLLIASAVISGCSKPKYTDDFIKSESNKIIGNLKFGMSKKEADDEVKNFNKHNQKDNGKFINDFQYDYISCDFDFDRLYSVCIHGMKNSKADDTSELRDLLKAKYQDPDIGSYTYAIRGKEVKPPYYFDNLKTWAIGNKYIVIQEEVRDTVKTVNLLIYRQDIENWIISRKERGLPPSDSIYRTTQDMFN